LDIFRFLTIPLNIHNMIFRFFLGALLMMVGAHTILSQRLVINEVVSSNIDGIADEDNSFEDWIELYNAENFPVNLEGFGLSDHPSQPFKWVFPSYVIQPGEYLLIWASGKNRKEAFQGLTNGIYRKFYANIPGASVQNLLSSPKFPNQPDQVTWLKNFFEAPIDVGDEYGQEMHALVKAPLTGQYTFWISSDDNSRLLLSSDRSPDNLQPIAEVPDWTWPREWEKFPQQKSVFIPLVKDSLYYLSALMKEAYGGDNLALRWRLPNGVIEEPLSAQHCFIEVETFFHTNFKISSSGEPLLLHSPQGILIDQMPQVPIPVNLSFGRLPHDLDNWYLLEKTTPGQANSVNGFTNRAHAPRFTPQPGIYEGPAEISILSDSQPIYYTLDGSIPTRETGNLYTQPFWVEGSARIRAAAIPGDQLSSEISAGSWLVKEAGFPEFDSNLPLLVIQQFNSLIEPGDRSIAYMTLLEPQANALTQLTQTPTLQSRININVRGSSSQSFPKKGYGFHIFNEDNSNRKIELLGMPAEHNWVLHGPFSDKSLMRNKISYEMSSEMGHYAPRTRFIELFLHQGDNPLSTPDYHGVYLLVERIKIAEGRLELEELEPYHQNYPEISGGYIIKNDRLNPGESGLLTQRGSRLAYVRPNEQTINQEQREYLKNYLDTLERVLFGPDFNHPNQGYSSLLDVNSFIDYHLLTEICKEIDGFRLSTFLFKDRMGKLHIGPVWDFNLSLGNADYLLGWQPEGWYHPLIDEYQYLFGWYNQLFKDEKFTKAYATRYRQLRQSVFSNPQLIGKIRNYQEELQSAQVRNFLRWDILGKYVWPNYFIGATFDEEIDFMVDWLEKRLAWMDAQLGLSLDLIHYWNFNDPTSYLEPSFTLGHAAWSIEPGPQTEITTGSGQNFSGQNARLGDGAGTHLRINNPIGTECTLLLPTTGYEDIVLTYETRRSGNGSNRQYIDFSLDGEIFTPWDSITLTEIPSLYTANFENCLECSDNPDFRIKIRFENLEGEEGGTAGNNRIDNLTLEGTPMESANRPPVLVKDFPAQIALVAQSNLISSPSGLEEVLMDLGEYIVDPDGDTLHFALETDHPEVSFELNNQSLLLRSSRQGEFSCRLIASDSMAGPLMVSFSILAYPEAKKMAQESFLFSNWDENEPAGSFPDHMLFLQSDINDPKAEDPVVFAYSIPTSDYASSDIDNIGFPYRNQSRTRINGLGEEGISFINTGRGRDLGAAVLSLDTRNCSNLIWEWSASTLRANSRVYALQPFFREGITQTWQPLLQDDGEPWIYQRSSIENRKDTLKHLAFPNEMLENPYVQLMWKYYFTGQRITEESGARDMLALHHIFIEKQTANSSVDQKPLDSQWTVFPNPVENYLYVDNPISGVIYDMKGMPILLIKNQSQVDLQGIPPGVYWLRTQEGQVLKIIKK
jgi:hypothetical protein